MRQARIVEGYRGAGVANLRSEEMLLDPDQRLVVLPGARPCLRDASGAARAPSRSIALTTACGSTAKIAVRPICAATASPPGRSRSMADAPRVISVKLHPQADRRPDPSFALVPIRLVRRDPRLGLIAPPALPPGPASEGLMRRALAGPARIGRARPMIARSAGSGSIPSGRDARRASASGGRAPCAARPGPGEGTAPLRPRHLFVRRRWGACADGAGPRGQGPAYPPIKTVDRRRADVPPSGTGPARRPRRPSSPPPARPPGPPNGRERP